MTAINTREKIIDSFKRLVIEQNFNSITIKEITDKAGIFRATFYYYFQDKYAVFEAILEEELFCHVRNLVQNDAPCEAMGYILRYFDKNRNFCCKAMQVEGVNSFRMSLLRQIRRSLELLTCIGSYKMEESVQKILTSDQIMDYLVKVIITTLDFILEEGSQDITCEERVQLIIRFILYGLNDLLIMEKR